MKKLLILAYIFVVAHTIKDFFQDFLETDFLYFFDANENLMILPKWGRWGLAVANQTADILAWLLIISTIPALIKSKSNLQYILIWGYILFFSIVAFDLLLDPRISNPQLFFDESTRIPAPEMKANYREILRQGPF